MRRVYRGLTEQKMRSDTRTARLKRAPRFGVGLRSERRVLKLLDKLPPADEPWAPMITTGDGHGQRVSGSDGDGGGGVGDGGGGGGGGGSGGSGDGAGEAMAARCEEGSADEGANTEDVRIAAATATMLDAAAAR